MAILHSIDRAEPRLHRASQFRLVLTVVLASIWLALSPSCSSSVDGSRPHADGGGDAACAVPQTERLYMSPGCGAAQPEPACWIIYPCVQYACGCDGRWVTGCNGFRGPYAWVHPGLNIGSMPDAGSCDPDRPPSP